MCNGRDEEEQAGVILSPRFLSALLSGGSGVSLLERAHAEIKRRARDHWLDFPDASAAENWAAAEESVLRRVPVVPCSDNADLETQMLFKIQQKQLMFQELGIDVVLQRERSDRLLAQMEAIRQQRMSDVNSKREQRHHQVAMLKLELKEEKELSEHLAAQIQTEQQNVSQLESRLQESQRPANNLLDAVRLRPSIYDAARRVPVLNVAALPNMLTSNQTSNSPRKWSLKQRDAIPEAFAPEPSPRPSMVYWGDRLPPQALPLLEFQRLTPRAAETFQNHPIFTPRVAATPRTRAPLTARSEVVPEDCPFIEQSDDLDWFNLPDDTDFLELDKSQRNFSRRSTAETESPEDDVIVLQKVVKELERQLMEKTEELERLKR